MLLQTQPYLEQLDFWPPTGRHILAQFDEDSVVVYQAYPPNIAHFAVQNGHFGGDFSFERMSWIKPNFLWMMFRSGWGELNGQTCVLAISIARSLWEDILAQAVPSSFSPRLYGSRDEWQRAVQSSAVLLQWDPDHGPRGHSLQRRAIQLGLRRKMLRRFASECWNIEDISDFVREQKQFALNQKWKKLQTPRERVYGVDNPETARRLGLDEA